SPPPPLDPPRPPPPDPHDPPSSPPPAPPPPVPHASPIAHLPFLRIRTRRHRPPWGCPRTTTGSGARRRGSRERAPVARPSTARIAAFHTVFPAPPASLASASPASPRPPSPARRIRGSEQPRSGRPPGRSAQLMNGAATAIPKRK